MNYYPRNVGHYAKKTLGLNQGQHGAYNLLIDACYASETGIEVDEVYAISKATTPAERKNTDKVLAKFFELRDGRYYQSRVEEEIAAYRDKSAQAKAAADARWGNSVDKSMRPHMRPDKRTHMPPQSERNAEGDASGMLIQNTEPKASASTVIETAPRPPAAEAAQDQPQPPDATRTERIDELCKWGKVQRIDGDKALIIRWIQDGVTDTQIAKALAESRVKWRKPEPQELVLAYVATVLGDIVAEDRKARETSERRHANTQRELTEQREAAKRAMPRPAHIPAPRKPREAAHREPQRPARDLGWWETVPGIQATAKDHGVRIVPEEPWDEFKARVLAAAGPGPWFDQQAPSIRERVEHYRAVGVNP